MPVKAKLQYSSWFEAGRQPTLNLSATSFEPDSVMEFRFNCPYIHDRPLIDINVL